ncbi:hypothetical protein JHK82_054759 [Glycine max]|uniref:Uncharacterized protein n=2 Tax=Glycine subgen. Soja TaxID=1462606 RepID=A0A0R0F547_SOYBN|nr:hypothetical protein JHK86_054611 [Glycine max]KAG4917114.1 hypothetical protein JHK87_054671 [Glycine soja]KAG4929080.1 hypothetical protein JHK85_055566 [Glycine max]KAG5084590.1 hypothetical protein JHK84_054628 [Glycine max]KAG5087362.1 hypothetical protein JHK82_054759 [Glycine max]
MVCCKAIKFMMKKSPTHELYQECYYEARELDLHENFSQRFQQAGSIILHIGLYLHIVVVCFDWLLEEAKQNVVNEAKLRSNWKTGIEKVKKGKVM